MTESGPESAAADWVRDEATEKRLVKRYRAERRFRAYGIAAILFALTALVSLLATVTFGALSALTQSSVRLEVELDREAIDPFGDGSPESFASGDYRGPARAAMREAFPDVSGRKNNALCIRS